MGNKPKKRRLPDKEADQSRSQMPPVDQVEKIKAEVEEQIEKDRTAHLRIAPPHHRLGNLNWSKISARRFLVGDPPQQEWLFEGLVPKGIVGGLFSRGGVGKSFLLLHLAFSLVTGERFGPFKPHGEHKVVYISGEDPEDQLWLRTRSIAKPMKLDNKKKRLIFMKLGVMNAAEEIGTLLHLDSHKNPETTEGYESLLQLIDGHKPQVLILDPMVLFYGLDENDNSHAAAWIRVLGRICQEYDLTVLFAHHEPKSQYGRSLAQSSGRGASALRDGCRWIASLGELTDREAKELGVGLRELIKLEVSKSNYGPYLNEPAYFMRGPGGILTPVDPHTRRLTPMAEHLLSLLEKSEIQYSMTELQKGPKGKPIADELKENFQDFNRSKDIPAIISRLIKQNQLNEVSSKTTGTRGRPKMVLIPVRELKK